MRFLPWAVALVAGMLAGVITCAGFVVRRSRLAWAGLAGTAALGTLAVSLSFVWAQNARIDTTIAAVFIALGALVGGHALAAELLPALTRPRQAPVTVGGIASGEGLGVVLLVDAESGAYRARDVTRDMEALERCDVPLPPHVARPLVYASERARYVAGGGSPARAAVGSIAKALRESLSERGVSEAVELAFCTGEPDAAEAVARLAARSGLRIVIAPLSVARSQAFDAAAAAVHALDPSGTLLDIEYAEPLWASRVLAVADAQRALTAFGDSGITDGIVLVSRGNPWQVDRLFPAAVEQATSLTQRIRAELIEAGLPPERVRQAWLEWEEPEVREAVRHLAALGATHIALVPVDMLFDSLATAVDLPMAAERAASESDVRVALMGPLGDDPALITALRRSITEAARRLPSGQ